MEKKKKKKAGNQFNYSVFIHGYFALLIKHDRMGRKYIYIFLDSVSYTDCMLH